MPVASARQAREIIADEERTAQKTGRSWGPLRGSESVRENGRHKKTMSCKKCGGEIPEGGQWCPWCGAAQVRRPPAARKRGNGQGNAYRRGGTWTARVVVGWRLAPDDPLKLRPVWRTKGGFRTKREALEYCPMLRTEERARRAPKLAQYWETYSGGEMEQLSDSKRTAYKCAWNKLAALHWRPVDQISVAELRNVVSAEAKTYYPARDCRTVLTRLFELAGADGWCSKDLPSYIVLPKLQEREREAFSETEQAALWRLYEAGDMRAAIPLLMISTGMMPGEMQNLRVEHIDLDAQKIVGVGMKTKVRRESPVYLPADVLPLVADLMARAQPSGYIWARNEARWYADYYAALEAAGVRRLEPYCCRHTTATRLAITEGIAPQTVKRMMRWSTTRMLDRYAHPDDADVINAADTLRKPGML